MRFSRLSGVSEGKCSQLERNLGEGKKQRQPFGIPGEKEQPFMHQASIQTPTADFQGEKKGCKKLIMMSTCWK